MDKNTKMEPKLVNAFTSTYVDCLRVWSKSIFYSLMVTGYNLKMAFTIGFLKYFNWQKVERPACLDDPTLGTHGYMHLEDVRLHYVSSGPEDKPLMLFVHGFPDFWFTWRHQIREFQKDYRVVAIDLRGYNASDIPKGISPYMQDKLSTDVKQVVLALGYKSCTLVGHDWGGVIAWSVGRMFPEVVDRLIVLNAPPASVLEKQLETNPDQRKRAWYMFFFQMPYLAELTLKANNFRIFNLALKAYGLDETEIETYRYVFSQPGCLTAAVNFYRGAFQKGMVHHDLNYTMPVLLIWGMKDKALSVTLAEECLKRNPKIVLERIEKSGHFVQFEAAQEVNQTIRKWLDQNLIEHKL